MSSSQRLTSSVSFQFSAEGAAEPGAPGSGPQISLDDKRNIEVHGQQKSTLAPGDSVYLKILGDDDKGVELSSSAGSISRVGTGIRYPYTEDVVFAMSSEGRLSNVPVGAVSYEWLGNNGGTPLFDGPRVSLSKPVTGVLRCTYDAPGSRHRLTVRESDMGGEDDITVVVAASQDGQVNSVQAQYSKDEEGVGGEPVPVDLEVSDFCSGESVGDVTVYLNGKSVGTTNASGRIYLGELVPGSTHDLKMTKDGYIDSDKDVLHNDSFTVPN